jgi:ABC-type Na+ efflux pump permease subunit
MGPLDMTGARAGAQAPSTPGDLPSLALIAWRGTIEALRDRTTALMSLLFAVIFPVVIVLTTVRPTVEAVAGGGGAAGLGRTLAIGLLMVGLLPSTAAVGVAAGLFAGEKEAGSLAPLLASPASNIAIFGGKVLGAVAPAIIFSIVAEGAYLGALVAATGADTLRQLPPALSLAMLALVPAVALFAATVASLISSRVRTFNTAQQIGSLVLLPLWGLLFSLGFKLGEWGPGALFAAVAGLLAADAALVALAAATWRREEVLARR